MAPPQPGSGESQPLVAEALRPAAVAGVAFACLSGLALGYDIGTTNGALKPIAKTFGLHTLEVELFAGALNAAALPGCLLAAAAVDKFGRRGTIALGAVLFLIGNALMTFALHFIQLVIGRALAGFAIGTTLVAEPLYTAETSPARLRGMLSTNVEVSYNVGILSGFVSSWAFGGLPDGASWRWMLGLGLVAPVVSLIGVYGVLYESPRWLAAQGRLEEADVALRSLLGPREAKKTFEAMQRESADKRGERDLLEVLRSTELRRLLLIGGGVAFFSQATGIESIMYYSGVILESGGMPRNDMLLAMIALGICKLIAIMVQGLFVDRTGRRPLLMVSSLGMSTCMAMLGISFFFRWDVPTKVGPIIFFVVFFSAGFGPIVYTLNGELFPTSCRSVGLMFAMVAGRVTSAVVSMSFLTLAEELTMGGAFACFSVCGLLATTFVCCMVPETAGTILDEDKAQR